MYEFLEKLFGKDENGEPKALTFKELVGAIETDKSIKLVNLKEGGYVSQEKFEAKETELKGVKEQLDAANDQIKSFEGQDIEGIKAKVSEWEQKYKDDTEALQKKMEAQEIAHQKDMYFSNVKFTSNAAKVGMMAEFDKQAFQLKDGVFQGADAWLEEQKKNDPASFVQEKPDDGKDGKEGNGNGNNGAGAGNQPPRRPQFAASTSNGSGQSGDQMSVFNFGFRHVRQKPDEQ